MGTLMEQLQTVIREIEQAWPSKHVLVVGDVMLDKYIWGDVGRISPEAPVPIVRVTRQTEQPGGAANVAMNLARLGAKATVIGFTGGDDNEHLLAQSLRSNGIAFEFVVSEGFPTTSKLRILSGRQQMLRLDTERQDNRPSGDTARLLQAVLEKIHGCDVVILSDYAKGTLSHELCQKLIEAANNQQIPVLVDPKCTDFSKYRGATTICPNLIELSAATHHDPGDLEPLLDAAESNGVRIEPEFPHRNSQREGHCPATARPSRDSPRYRSTGLRRFRCWRHGHRHARSLPGLRAQS